VFENKLLPTVLTTFAQLLLYCCTELLTHEEMCPFAEVIGWRSSEAVGRLSCLGAGLEKLVRL
jgi:hypothetical protein